MKIKIKSLIISTSFLLVLFCFASAGEPYDGESVDPYNINSLEDALNYMNITSFQKQIILDAFEEYCSYYQIYFDNDHHSMAVNGTDVPGQYVTCPFVDSNPWRCSGMYYLAKSDITPTYILVLRINGSDVSLFFKTPGTSGNYMTVFNSEFQSLYGSDQTFTQYYDNTGNVLISGDVSPQSTKETLYCYSIEGQHVLMQDNRSNVRPLGESPLFGFPESHKFYIREQASSVSDDRLKLSHVFGLGGVDNLLVNLSEFYLETGFSLHTSTVFSDVTLELEFVDDHDNITTESFVLSSSNSTIEKTSYPSEVFMYLIQTPYSTFGDFSNYDSVRITSCSFERTFFPAGLPPEIYNFNISCNFYLKESASQSAITPEDIDLPDYEDPEVVSQSQIEQIRQQLQEDSTAPNANTGDWSFVQDHPVVPSWADHYDFRVIYSDSNSFVGNLVNANVWNYYTSNDPNGLGWITSGFIPKEFLHNNSAAMFYDMIIISVYSANVALAPDNLNLLVYNNIELQGYLVFYSERYYIHRQALTQQDILSVLEYESYNDLLYYTYVKDKLDDFELKTLNGFSQLIGINKNTNSWLSSLDLRLTGTNQQLQQILTAINNIDIPEAPDLGEITDTLEYLFIPSFSWSTINYNEYLDSLGILSMPFRFGSSVFSGLENGYSPNLEYHLYEASVPLPASLGVSGNSFKLWDDQDFTLVTASIFSDQDLLSNIRLFNLIICIMSQAFLTYLHIFRREGGVEDGI